MIIQESITGQLKLKNYSNGISLITQCHKVWVSLWDCKANLLIIRDLVKGEKWLPHEQTDKSRYRNELWQTSLASTNLLTGKQMTSRVNPNINKACTPAPAKSQAYQVVRAQRGTLREAVETYRSTTTLETLQSQEESAYVSTGRVLEYSSVASLLSTCETKFVPQAPWVRTVSAPCHPESQTWPLSRPTAMQPAKHGQRVQNHKLQ